MSDLVEGKIGPEADYDVDLIEGNLVLALNYKGEQLETSHVLKLSFIKLLRKAALKTSNKLDDKAVDMIEALL